MPKPEWVPGQHSPAKFDAMPYAFTSIHPVKSPFKWNDYGFEVDGPVSIPELFDLRNKLFIQGPGLIGFDPEDSTLKYISSSACPTVSTTRCSSGLRRLMS